MIKMFIILPKDEFEIKKSITTNSLKKAKVARKEKGKREREFFLLLPSPLAGLAKKGAREKSCNWIYFLYLKDIQSTCGNHCKNLERASKQCSISLILLKIQGHNIDQNQFTSRRT